MVEDKIMTKEKTDNCDPVYLSYYFDSLSINKEMNESKRRDTISSMIEGCYNYKMSKCSNEAPVKPIKKKKRPSGYNLFIGGCMKKDKHMKACSVEWKDLNEYNKNDWRAKATEGRVH